VDDYIDIRSEPSINFGTGDFSIDAWIRTTHHTGVAVILDKRQQNPYQGYHLFTSDGDLFLQMAVGGTYNKHYANYPAARLKASFSHIKSWISRCETFCETESKGVFLRIRRDIISEVWR
jgi:hypothetical protein